MSNVDSLPEPAAGIKRRGLLAAAGGMAVAGVLPTVALAQPAEMAARHSPEFRQWYALASTLKEVAAADDKWELANPEANMLDNEDRLEAGHPYLVFCAEMERLEWAIYHREVRSWVDVAELGMITLFWDDKKGLPTDTDADSENPYAFSLGRSVCDPEATCQGDRPVLFLIQAAAKLAMGGANV